MIGVLAAGARLHPLLGTWGAILVLSLLIWIWARWTSRQRLGDWFSRIAVYGFIVWMMMMLMVPDVGSHSGGRLALCLKHLKEIGFGLLAYEKQNQSLPPLCTIDSDGKPLVSWRTALLPFVERTDLYSQYQLNEPWDSLHNHPLSQIQLQLFQCPADYAPNGSSNYTNYVAVIGPGTAWQPGKAIKLSDIKDKLSETILLVEMKNSGIAWSEPRDLDLNNLPPGLTPQNLLKSLSYHAGGFNALFADGTVRFVRGDILWSEFMAMLTIAGGETINQDDW
jgi:prepilin-type processing-associated H-X9-DG protein